MTWMIWILAATIVSLIGFSVSFNFLQIVETKWNKILFLKSAEERDCSSILHSQSWEFIWYYRSNFVLEKYRTGIPVVRIFWYYRSIYEESNKKGKLCLEISILLYLPFLKFLHVFDNVELLPPFREIYSTVRQ